MYYEERWIGGKFCWRTSPDGAWTAYTANELAHRYQAELQRAHDLQRALDAERERARVATQLIIETIGSSGGPEDLEEALGRMTAKLATLQARCAHLDVLLRDEYLPKLDVVAVQRSIADRDSRIDALEREVEKLDDDKETLQAQLADRDAMILQMGEQAAVLAKENMAVKAQLQQVEEERDRAEGALIRAGFRKDCDIAACNCGPQWGHGGHASQRLREIADALPYQNGGVLLERIESLVRENATLRQLVAQLPVVDAQEVSVWLSPDESGWLVSKRPAFPAGLYWAKFRTQAEADSFRALLAYRATLAVQDAPQPAPNERVEYARLELAALFSTPGAPTLEQAKLVCENKNPADAQCILNAYEALLTHRQGMGG